MYCGVHVIPLTTSVKSIVTFLKMIWAEELFPLDCSIKTSVTSQTLKHGRE
jgi:hypothetical protein